MKKLFGFVFCALINLTLLPALDFTFKFEPMMLLPKEEYMESAFGGSIFAGLDILNAVTFGGEGGYLYERPANTEGSINVVFGGANLGFYYYPFSRIYTGLGGSAGVASFMNSIGGSLSSGENFSGIYYRGYGELGFRITPAVSINAAGGYASFNSDLKQSFISGPYGSVSLRLSASTGNGSSHSTLSVGIEQRGDVYPVYSSLYSYEPFGSIIIKNNDGAELRNVHVSFRAGRYTSGAKLCGTASRINRHSSTTFPLCAEFAQELLSFTENGKFSGEVVVDYELLGKKVTVVEPVIISVKNRNAFLWSDNAALVSFISPDSQEVAAFAKEAAGVTRNCLLTGTNAPLQYAAGIIEALRLTGVTYSNDKVTPYREYHLSDRMDSIQYPLQTLQYLSGDYDDLGILVCSCLQTVNVSTGYIPLDDDFIVLVKLGIPPRNAASHFASRDGLFIDEENNEVYMPLAMSRLENGFYACLKAGREALKKCSSNPEGYYEAVDTVAAWASYKPAAFSNNSSVKSPRQEELVKRIKAAIQDYVSGDMEAVIRRERSAGDINKLGVALVRAGRYAEAKAEFQKLNSVSAMNNLANIYMIEKKYASAAAQYKKVLARSPDNKIALKGLDKANAKIE